MKKISLFIALALLLSSPVTAQNTPVTKSNYQLAERFSAPKVQKMVYSRDVKPVWLKDGKSFWYAYQTSQGVTCYLVDCQKETKKLLFDHVDMAAKLSAITGDPMEAKNLKISGIKFENDGKSFQFEVKSNKEIDKKLSKSEQKKETEKKAKLEKEGKKYEAPKPKKEKKTFYFNYNLASGKLSELVDYEKKKQYPAWASVSPDGKIAVFSKNYNLYYMDSANLAKAVEDSKDSTIVEHQITTDGVDGFGYGKDTDNMTEEEIAKFPKERYNPYIVWSPDSKHFALLKSDVKMLKKLWVINSVADPRPTLESYRYQMPGEDSPITYLMVFNTDTKKGQTINISEYKGQMVDIMTPQRKQSAMYDYYTPSVWMGGNDFFYISRTSRDHQRQDMNRVDLTKGTVSVVSKTEMNVSLEERGLYMLAGGKRHIVRSERDGWAHYYLYNSDGTLKNQITKGEYHADALVGVDEKAGVMYFSAYGVVPDENPYYEHLCSVNLDGSDLKVLNKGNYHFVSNMNDDQSFFVSTYSRVDTAPVSALYNSKGKKIMELEVADLSTLMASGYKFPERFVVKAADGITDLYGVMYKPFDFDSTKLYPIIEY
ncbi:MAG: DPP IV N-terminal domain-containing protein, partial [Rikenellaceae bacterium]